MHVEMNQLVIAIAIGVGATLVMDAWGLVLKRAFNVASLSYCLVGRWLRYMPEGVFKHASIAASAPKPGECALGWIAHYAIGVVFALALVALVPTTWLREPTVLPALALGIATVAIPFFVMQPSFGLGIAASKTPNPGKARVRSLMTHLVFGLGMYVAALALSFLI